MPQKKQAKTMLMGVAPVPGAAKADKPTPEDPRRSPSPGMNPLPEKRSAAASKTMLGVAAVRGPAPTAGKREKAAQGNKTMLGVASPMMAIPQKTDQKPAGVAGPPMARAVAIGGQRKPDPTPTSKSNSVAKKTMLGMPAISDATGPSSDAPPPAKPSREPKPSRQEPKRAVKSTPAPTAPVEAPKKSKASPEPRGPAEPAKPASPATEPIEAMREPPLSPSLRAAEPWSRGRDTFDSWPDEPPAREPRRGGLMIALVVVSTLIICFGGVLIYMMFFTQSPGINPQVFPSPDGKNIIVSLPLNEAPPGTMVRFAEQIVPVTQGQAQITIPMNQLKLGANDITLSYQAPATNPKPITFPIVLRHTITDDLTGLMSDNPSVAVIFNVAPSVMLSVEGKPVPIADGSYVYRIPFDKVMESAKPGSDQIIHNVPFQLTDQTGATESGQHGVIIQLTDLQVDRPAENALIAAEEVTCSGTTDTGAAVTINGEPVGVTALGFSTTVPLPVIGQHSIKVTAHAPGKAPRTRILTVKRLESLDTAIAEWSRDLDPSLDYPTIGRDPNAYAGKKIKLNGRVVNISTEKGVTAFILYVREGCPARGKCAVYVVFRGETDAGLQSWVDVYGTVRGTRSVDLQQGLKIEVPAVDATFVVKQN